MILGGVKVSTANSLIRVGIMVIMGVDDHHSAIQSFLVSAGLSQSASGPPYLWPWAPVFMEPSHFTRRHE